MWISYPTSAGNVEGYVKTTAVFQNMPSKTTASAKIKTYKRPGAEEVGAIEANDTVYYSKVVNGYVQVMYPAASGKRAWKIAVIKESAAKSGLKGFASSSTAASSGSESLTKNQQLVAEKAKSLVGATTLPIGGNAVNYRCQALVYQIVYLGLGKSSKVDVSKSTAKEAQKAWMQSTSMKNIPVGAAVYYNPGNAEGHVGIYVGDNMVVHGRSKVLMESLESMNKQYGYVGWGWQAGFKLN